MSRVLVSAAVLSAVTALTPGASADVGSDVLDPSDGCGARIHYIQVGGNPIVQFAGEVDISNCVGPINT